MIYYNHNAYNTIKRRFVMKKKIFSLKKFFSLAIFFFGLGIVTSGIYRVFFPTAITIQTGISIWLYPAITWLLGGVLMVLGFLLSRDY